MERRYSLQEQIKFKFKNPWFYLMKQHESAEHD